MTYDNFMMDKIVHQEIYKKRMLFVKQIQLGTPHSWYAGYLEIIPSDPPFWKQKEEKGKNSHGIESISNKWAHSDNQ